MSIRDIVRQVKPVLEKNSIDYVERVQTFFAEDIDFPKDILDGFEFTQVDKSEKATVQIKVLSADRDTELIVDTTVNGVQVGMQYARLTPLLVKAVQELSAKVEEQQKEIEELKNK